MSLPAPWRAVCSIDDILPDTGVCADLDGRQIALFRVEEMIYAIDNHDPASGANVLSRGIVGDLGGELVVASPLYKHHYSLTTGRCLEEPDHGVGVYPVRVLDGTIWVKPLARHRGGASAKRRLVVVGNGMAGMRTVDELQELAPGLYDIEIFGAEPHGNYNRILLSPVLAGEKRIEDIMLHPLSWYSERAIRLHTGDPVVSIDRRRRHVVSAAGIEVRYDRLLLATGSNPVVLSVPGSDLPGVLTFRDLDDVHTLLEAARTHRTAVVIGGGLLGLEAANGLRSRGMDVTVVHLSDRLMNRQLDPAAAALLQRSLEARGIHFKLSATTQEICATTLSATAPSAARRVAAVRFADGSELPADLVVLATGITPNVELARRAGLHCGRGIVVDDTLQTYDPCIYAVGECVQHRNSTFGLVAPLWEQARVCAAHLAEIGVARYVNKPPATQLKVTGIDVFSAGDFLGTARSESLVLRDPKRGVYKRLIVEDGKVRGAVLVGDTADGPWYVELMNEARDIGPLRDKLLFGAAAARAS